MRHAVDCFIFRNLVENESSTLITQFEIFLNLGGCVFKLSGIEINPKSGTKGVPHNTKIISGS